MQESEKWKWSRSVVSDSSRSHGLQPTRLLRPWGFPGKSTGVGCHFLLHKITLGWTKVVNIQTIGWRSLFKMDYWLFHNVISRDKYREYIITSVFVAPNFMSSYSLPHFTWYFWKEIMPSMHALTHTRIFLLPRNGIIYSDACFSFQCIFYIFITYLFIHLQYITLFWTFETITIGPSSTLSQRHS